MTNQTLTENEQTFIKLWLSQVEQYIGNRHSPDPLALKDQECLKAALNGELTEHFYSFLESSIEQIHNDFLPTQLNTTQVEVMEGLFSKRVKS